MRKRAKPGPGHPVTTGSASVPKVSFRLPAAEQRELEVLGETEGVGPSIVAKEMVRVALARRRKT